MPKFDATLEKIYAPDRQTWRQWLSQNNASAAGGWLVYFKKHSGKPSVSYNEAVEEALCFGWIDSKTNKLDDDSYMQIFTPRKPGSVWSKLNKQRVEKLLADGSMTPAGLAKIEQAKLDGSWSLLDAIEELLLPADFEEALKSAKPAFENFMAFSRSVRKGMLWHIESARRPETRAKRIQQLVEGAREGKNVLAYMAKEKSKMKK